jgi:hypothetical protein
MKGFLSPVGSNQLGEYGRADVSISAKREDFEPRLLSFYVQLQINKDDIYCRHYQERHHHASRPATADWHGHLLLFFLYLQIIMDVHTWSLLHKD